MTAYCMAFSKCCRKLAKWGSGYVLISYPRIRKKCIQERIQSLLTTDYRLLQILNCISNTFYLLKYSSSNFSDFPAGAAELKISFLYPVLNWDGLNMYSVSKSVFSVLLCILNIFSLTAPATKVTFQQEQLPTGHQVNVSCSAKNIFPQPRIKLTWGLL